MSKCISSYGEYSEHTEVSPGDGVCGYCGDVDLDSIRAKAWAEGYDRALRSHCDALDLDGRCDVEDPNPYAEEAT